MTLKEIVPEKVTGFTAGNDRDSICSFVACLRPSHAAGLCSGHYWQQRQGRTLAPLRPKRTKHDDPAQSFWERVDRSADCWLWLGAKSDGYGAVQWDGRRRGAHVVAYELVNGPLPEGSIPDHRCRNRSCVNPKHLRPATPKQNAENRGAQSNNTSGFRGVMRDRRGKRWIAYAGHYGIKHFAPGSFATAEEANEAAIRLRSELFTHAEELAS